MEASPDSRILLSDRIGFLKVVDERQSKKEEKKADSVGKDTNGTNCCKFSNFGGLQKPIWICFGGYVVERGKSNCSSKSDNCY